MTLVVCANQSRVSKSTSTYEKFLRLRLSLFRQVQVQEKYLESRKLENEKQLVKLVVPVPSAMLLVPVYLVV